MRGEGERRRRDGGLAFGTHVAVDLGVLELLDVRARASSSISAASAAALADVAEVDDDVGSVGGGLCFVAQVDHRRAPRSSSGQPACAVAQPLDLITEPLGDQLAAGQLAHRGCRRPRGSDSSTVAR